MVCRLHRTALARPWQDDRPRRTRVVLAAEPFPSAPDQRHPRLDLSVPVQARNRQAGPLPFLLEARLGGFERTSEGVAEMIQRLIKEELGRHAWLKPFVFPLMPAFQRLRKRIDYAERGGAPLLGINGVCIIGHGRSDAYAVMNACRFGPGRGFLHGRSVNVKAKIAAIRKSLRQLD